VCVSLSLSYIYSNGTTTGTWEQVKTTEKKQEYSSQEEKTEEKKRNDEDVPAQMSTSTPRVYDLFKYSNKDMITSFAFCNSSRREVIVSSLKGLTQLTMKDDWSSSARVSLSLVSARARKPTSRDSEANSIEQRLHLSSASPKRVSRSSPSICVRSVRC
jgi:hypothetical protein